MTSAVKTSRDPLACMRSAKRVLAEAREHDRVDRADAHGREHEHDRLGAGGHVDRERSPLPMPIPRSAAAIRFTSRSSCA